MYDLTVITKDQKGADVVSGAVAEVEGKILNQAELGLKPLAYPIEKNIEAFYSHFIIDVPADKVVSLETTLRTNPNILRFLILKTKSTQLAKKIEVEERRSGYTKPPVTKPVEQTPKPEVKPKKVTTPKQDAKLKKEVDKRIEEIINE